MGKFDYWILVRLFGSVPLSFYVPDNSKNTYTAFFIIPSLIAINTLIVISSLTAIILNKQQERAVDTIRQNKINLVR